MKRLAFIVCYLIIGITIYATEPPSEQEDGKWEICINVVGTWLDSGTEEDVNKLIEDGVFYAVGYYFDADGWLRITEYEGLLLEMTKKESRYQYKFSDKYLTLTADGQTENILYELKYHSLAGTFLVLHWKGKDIMLIKPNESALQMLQDFETNSTRKGLDR